MAKVLIDNDHGTVRIEFRDIMQLAEIPTDLANDLAEAFEDEPFYAGHCGRCHREITDRGQREDSLEACEIHADRCEG